MNKDFDQTPRKRQPKKNQEKSRKNSGSNNGLEKKERKKRNPKPESKNDLYLEEFLAKNENPEESLGESVELSLSTESSKVKLDEHGMEISSNAFILKEQRISSKNEFERLKKEYIEKRTQYKDITVNNRDIQDDSDGKVYVLDTNIILNDANNLYVISQNGENTIVLPETVIDEIDSKKSGFDEINFQAREFARILSEAAVESYKEDDNGTVVSINVNGLKVDIISLKKYDTNGLEKSIINDRKIILVAKYAKEYYKGKEVKLLSLDVMCRIRAVGFNVDTDSLSYSKKDMDLEFIKRVDIEGDIPEDITEFDKDYKEENFCYIFNRDEEEIHAVIKNGKTVQIDMSMFKKGDIKPRNSGQMFAMHGMLDDDFNVVLIEALAGSGKTLLALAAGMRNLDLKRHDKIIYIRNSIESVDRGEDIGYLSGNDEKMKIYNYPLYDTLDFIVRAKPGKKNDTEKDVENKVKLLMEKYKIETMWIGAIRGRTISNSYVIIDEIQNFSRKSLQTVLSRLDSDCKVVCIGSNRQIDNSFINKYTNGLSVLLERSTQINKEVSLFATRLDKVERGAITEWTEKVFTK
jgi:PhoH-like ATPase